MSSHDSQKAAWEEGVAIGFLHEIGSPAPPIDAFALAGALGLSVFYGSPPRTDGLTVYVPRKASEQRQQWLLAHELGHVLIDRAGLTQSEHGADLVALALLLPRYAIMHRLADGHEAIARESPHVPLECVIRRVAWLSEQT